MDTNGLIRIRPEGNDLFDHVVSIHEKVVDMGATTQKQRAVLTYLQSHPGATIKEIGVSVEGMTANGVKSNLQTLRQNGLLKRVGPDKGRHWEVIEAGQ